MSSRFIVGIDLGTTNSVLAYLDTEAPEEEGRVGVLEVPQLVAAGTVETRTQLPSFLWLTAPDESKAGALRLPWDAPEEGRVVGVLAARRAPEVPDRVVTSAKSWLCHPGVDRTRAILPWADEGDDVENPSGRLSPLEASTAYLSHLRAAWDSDIGARKKAPLGKQDLYLTVPASFDAVARDLTVQAAAAAGLENVHLLEEPQAAVYAWLEQEGESWRDKLAVGDVLLVCDVGGGTTDFSLVLVEDEQGALALTRVAVGDHILLGGDNMDLALAYAIRSDLAKEGKRLDAWQLRGLLQSCREAKERLLSSDGPREVPLSVLGRGRKLVGGTLRAKLTRARVNEVLLEGFFPQVDREASAEPGEAAGLSEIGLPFASDPGVTRHLAAFLRTHRSALQSAGGATRDVELPTVLLFNGGVMAASAIAERVQTLVETWARELGQPPARSLLGVDFSHAVARGAACYGRARRGEGVRIRGGTARSYYVGVGSALPAVPGQPAPVKALCVVPFGIEEGTQIEVPKREFGLRVGETAKFRFFASSRRNEDYTGDILDEFETEELDELEPLRVELDGAGGAPVPVRLSAHVTEIGTLELFFVGRGKKDRWRLEFTVRQAPEVS